MTLEYLQTLHQFDTKKNILYYHYKSLEYKLYKQKNQTVKQIKSQEKINHSRSRLFFCVLIIANHLSMEEKKTRTTKVLCAMAQQHGNSCLAVPSRYKIYLYQTQITIILHCTELVSKQKERY
jgi:hypothetical protein